MTKVRGNFKDSLFDWCFMGREELLSLYNAVNGSSYTNADDLGDQYAGRCSVYGDEK